MAFKIGIIGAGPAGLTTALALEAYCKSTEAVEITLLDKNRSAADYPGVEYGIQARACLALRRMGIKEEALACGLDYSRISFFNSRTNKKQNFSVSTDPDLTVTVVRQEFLAGLTKLVKRTRIKRQCNVKSIQSSPGKVDVLCEDAQGNDVSYEFDFLIAADGISSLVRREYFKNKNYIHNRGFSCLYMLIEVPNEGPRHLKDFANTGECWIVLGKSTTATFFPLGKDRFAVGIGFDDQVQAEIWRSVGADLNQTWADLDVSLKQTIAELLATDCSFQDNMLTQAFQWIPDWNSLKIYLWKMRDSDVATRPYNEHGNIIMIGDAAHAIMPTIGMGASLAIEDAEMLARHISDRLRQGKLNGKSAVETYSSVRVPVWKELMDRARAGARLNFVGVRHKSRFALGPQIPGRVVWRAVTAIEELIG
ncbi:FAD-dependent oxidoreductase [Spirosoma lituiforme]